MHARTSPSSWLAPVHIVFGRRTRFWREEMLDRDPMNLDALGTRYPTNGRASKRFVAFTTAVPSISNSIEASSSVLP